MLGSKQLMMLPSRKEKRSEWQEIRLQLGRTPKGFARMHACCESKGMVSGSMIQSRRWPESVSIKQAVVWMLKCCQSMKEWRLVLKPGQLSVVKCAARASWRSVKMARSAH